MSVVLVSLVGLVGLATAFDYTNGFHDSANSVATVVATGVLRPRLAVAWAAFWNFIAFLVFGTAVANTVAQTVKTPEIGLALIFAGLVGALAWNLASWHLGLPTSSTHALIGGLVGAALARGGWSAISVSNLTKTALTYAEGVPEEEEFPLRPGAGSLIPSAPAASEQGARQDRASGVQGRRPVPL